MFSPQFIKDYLAEKLKCDYRISSNNLEMMLPSVYLEHDHKRHMSINLETGLWQCFKTGTSGNFIKLYSILENIPYRSAQSKLLFQGVESGAWDLWEDNKVDKPSAYIPSYEADTSSFIPVNVESHASDIPLVVTAWKFLMDRKLFNLEEFVEKPYFVSTHGKYRNRLIIPFKDYDEDIFFFQARTLLGSMNPKYLNPSAEDGVKSSNILYPFDFEAESLCVCEGPADAISMNLNGLNATCTMGSTISNVQMQALKEFEGTIILAYDNDAAGEKGIQKFESLRKQHLLPTFSVCSPPSPHKDWNEAYMSNINLKDWISKNSYKYDFENRAIRNL